MGVQDISKGPCLRLSVVERSEIRLFAMDERKDSIENCQGTQPRFFFLRSFSLGVCQES